MVEQYLPEHPFIREGELSNAVLGSVVLAHAVTNDLLRDTDLRQLQNLSRQPFLWRSLRRDIIDPDALIDGRYLGCVLNSYWNDPITRNPRVIIRSMDDDGSASVQILGDNAKELVFNVTLPINLYRQVRDTDIDICGAVTLEGLTQRDSPAAFYVHGVTTVICDAMEIVADNVTLDGQVWFEANQVKAPPRLKLHFKNGTEFGWEGQFAEQYPWNRQPTTLNAPHAAPGEDLLAKLIDECRVRLPSGAALVLNADFTVPEQDARAGMRWAVRKFPVAFPRFIRLMVDFGFASDEVIGVSGSDPKIRVRFQEPWENLHNALNDPVNAPDELREFLNAVQHAIGE